MFKHTDQNYLLWEQYNFFFFLEFSQFSYYLICTDSHVVLNSMLFCIISAVFSLQLLPACLPA